MPKQFLLNIDGTIPANINIELLKANEIPLVLPTPIPKESGMIAVEQDPKQDANGIWHQVWSLEPISEIDLQSEQIVDPLASLTYEQKIALLSILQQ